MSGVTSYGAKLTPAQTGKALKHILSTNMKLQKKGQVGTPVCIWGLHGIGKTMMVQEFARENDWKYAYCAPAQFEEMGDLHGLPTRVQPGSGQPGDEYTAFLPPEWVPREPGPGILLLDDINRADDRILRGLMQLLQNYSMFSWALPPMWQIVATANPENGDYSVTTMDDAMLTRMLHLTMKWDVQSWARWATQHEIDPRGIGFVLAYPEMVGAQRTTPRSLTQVFEQLSGIKNWKRESGLVRVIASSALDDTTVATFINYVKTDMGMLLVPQDILGAKSYDDVSKQLKQLSEGKGGMKRVDILGVICFRLSNELSKSDTPLNDQEAENLRRFLLDSVLPNEQFFQLHKELIGIQVPSLKEVLTHRSVAKRLEACL